MRAKTVETMDRSELIGEVLALRRQIGELTSEDSTRATVSRRLSEISHGTRATESASPSRAKPAGFWHRFRARAASGR